MRHFESRQVEEARAYAEAGGQALHTHRVIVDRRKAPSCFVREVDAGRDIAHLFDRDEVRLVATARRLGVRVVKVERPARTGQHVDLCGVPLRRAMSLCDNKDTKS